MAESKPYYNLSAEALIESFISESFFSYLAEKINLLENLPAAKIQISECLKMLMLIPFSTGNAPMSKEIDDVWHFMILETREYEKLCQKLPNKKFIHHESVTFKKYSAQTETNRSQDLKNRLGWFTSYVYNFGPFTEQTIQYWPLGLELMKDKKINLDQLNDLLLKSAR